MGDVLLRRTANSLFPKWAQDQEHGHRLGAHAGLTPGLGAESLGVGPVSAGPDSDAHSSLGATGFNTWDNLALEISIQERGVYRRIFCPVLMI